MRVAVHRRLPLVAVTAVLFALVPGVPALASGYPNASVSLSAGPDVAGTVVVDGTGDVNPAGSDTVKSLGLYVDGALSGSVHSCDTSQKSCAAAFSWDSSGLTGVHGVAVRVVSMSGASATSPVTVVTVQSPSPVAAVTSPVAGSQVAGFVSVTGSGLIDPSQTDVAQVLQFYVDGDYTAQHSCTGSDVRSCAATFSWDTTTLYGLHTLQVRFRTASSLVVMSPAVTVQVGDPPAAYLTSPAAGSTVTGVVSVSGGGTIDPLQPDSVTSLQLLVDGAESASSSCAGRAQTSCAASLSWDSTGMAGQHQLQLRLTTGKGQTGLSPVVVVTADNPAPSVVLSIPATVSGTVSVAIRGMVDQSQTDAGSLVRLLADGRSVGTATCPAVSRICTAKVGWATKGLAGQHNLQALFTTTGGRTVSSAVTSVWVLSSVRVTLGRMADVQAGRLGTVSGRVLAADGSPGADVRVRVVVRNSLGRPPTDITVTTGPSGAFSASYKAVSNSVVLVSVAASARYGAAAATTSAAVDAAPVCTVRASVAKRVGAPVACHLGDAPKGTTVSLQALQGGVWRTLTTSRSTGPVWSFSQVFVVKGTIWVRVSVGASKDFGAAMTAPVKVVVG